ncbi:MAG TPA: UPF0175 family protein [Acetobacteraceae bacterium]|nr:UPF0175 family protein [Acetobacteraceae bacterium]
MNVVRPIPDELAERLTAAGDNLERRALEAFGLAEYQAGHLTHFELRQLLGMPTRFELDAFLKQHGIDDGTTLAEFAREREDLDQLGL